MPNLTTTLNAIRVHEPCVAGWKNLLAHLGKNRADDEPLHFRTILKSNGLDDTLWCLRTLPPEMDSAVRLLACDIVEPAMAYVPSHETRPRAAIDASRYYARGEITAEDLAAARDASRDAAWAASMAPARHAAWAAALAAASDARAAAREAAGAAVGAADEAAALAAALAAASDAAREAAGAAVGAAARATARAAARDAAVDTAWDAARAEQERMFVAWLDKMERADA